MSTPGIGNVSSLSRSDDHVIELALRLLCLIVLVALLTIHIRSVRVFRWEQSVSGGLMVTYVVAVVGLALCAGVEKCGAKVLQLGVRSLYGVRLLVLTGIVIAIRIHIRPMFMLSLTRSASKIALVLNVIFLLGLTICVGSKRCGFYELKIYISASGAVLLATNSIFIWKRWRHAGDMTRVVAELLGALGVPLRRQILIKASLSATAAVLMSIDLTFMMIRLQNK